MKTVNILKTTLILALWGTAWCGALGCEDTIDGTTGTTAVGTGNTPTETGTWITTVDATSQTDWVYFSFAEQQTVSEADTWDIAFQRTAIKTNGGVSGDGQVIVTHLDATLSAVTQAPDDGYRYDSVDSDGAIVYAFDAESPWYDYDITTHVLTPKPRTYVIRAADAFYRLAIVAYYDGVGTSGVVRFEWAAVDAPTALVEPSAGGEGGVDGSDLADGGDGVDGTDHLDGHDASDGIYPTVPADAVRLDGTQDWAYVSFENGAIQLVDAATSTAWDLGVKGSLIRTNSGLSGQGQGGAMLVSNLTWDTLQTTDTVGFVVDREMSEPGPPGQTPTAPASPAFENWYDYDVATHTLSANDSLYVVRGATGTYAKVTLLGAYDGVYDVKFATIPAQPEIHTTIVDTTQRTLLSFRADATVPTDAAASLEWDLAIEGLVLSTNGGTSGPGLGGAYATQATSLGQLTTVDPDWSFSPDELMPLPGPPGAGDVSGNPVLGNWYDYDMTTHTVSASGRVYVVATADGGYVKFAATDYTDDQLTLQWAYAGPGATEF